MRFYSLLISTKEQKQDIEEMTQANKRKHKNNTDKGGDNQHGNIPIFKIRCVKTVIGKDI